MTCGEGWFQGGVIMVMRPEGVVLGVDLLDLGLI